MKRTEIDVDLPPTTAPSRGDKNESTDFLAPESSLRPLRVLIIEDSENDALLLEIELQRFGYGPVCERVETRDAMRASLMRQSWDVIIADYVMPRFNGLEALALVKANGLDLPFIIVSGHITDGTAVAAMKAGAHDYVMKDNLARLGPAVQRELREAAGRHARRVADQKLQAEQVFRHAIENSVPAGITVVDLEGRQTYVNPAFCALVGWKQEDLLGAHPPFVYWPPENVEAITAELGKLINGHSPAGGLELRYRRQTGERISVLVVVTPLKDAYGNITGWVSSNLDISERKQAEARLAAEHAVTRLLANAPSLDLASPGIVEALLEGLEADVGGLWVPSEDKRELRLSAMNGRDCSAQLRGFIQASQQLHFKPGKDLPGRSWQSGRTVWMTDLSLDSEFERLKAAQAAGLQSGMAFPIQNDGQFFGVLEFFARQHLEESEITLNMMTTIASEIGQFTQRRGAEEALRRAHDELEVRVQQRTAQLKSANAKLQSAIAERKRLENELLEITEKERRRIALDLHDDLGQRLSGIALMTKGLELRLTKAKAETAPEAARIHVLVQEAMTHASELAHDMATLDLQQKTLPEALGQLAAHARQLFRISCDFNHEGVVPPLDGHVVMQMYKISQESLTNAIKHAKAKHVTISLVARVEHLLLTIENDGIPFPDLQGRSTGMGLRIMTYRANLIGGSLEIRANGVKGARVTCLVPLEK